MIRRLIANLFCLFGLAAIGYGLWQYSQPLAWGFAGAAVFAVGVLLVKGNANDS